MTEKTTTTEETTCACGRPAVYDPMEDEVRYCTEHQRVMDASERYSAWADAYEEMRERFSEVLDSKDDSPLQQIAGRAMSEIVCRCAHYRGELEIAEDLAEPRPEGLGVGGEPIGSERAEIGLRLLRRSDRLADAIDALCKTPGLSEGERWGMLWALYEARDRADEELARFKGDSPA